jgi:hypothetical protein
MVRKRNVNVLCSGLHDVLSLRASCSPIEALEQRIELTVPRWGWFTTQGDDPTLDVSSGPCGCLGRLCQCDGQDCIAICDSHCMIHYV